MDDCTRGQLREVFDILSFPRSDVVPGGFDDRTSILRDVAVFGEEAELGTACVAVLLDVDTPEGANKFNLVEILHVIYV